MSLTPTSMNKAEHILRDVFGFSAFRGGQADIISAVLSGKDVLGVLPTGAGKSLCYQIPALVFPRTTLVVSPLIALMKDQSEKLRSHGIAAHAIHSGLSQGDVNDVLYRASTGRVKVLFVAPERLESRTFRSQLNTIPLSLLAIDEAHCISEWGHDFRPSYRNIMQLFDSKARVPILALTASATPDVRSDIKDTLSLIQPIEIVRGFARSNLCFNVEQTASKIEWLTQHVRSIPKGSVIVYSGSRRRVDVVVEELQKRGIGAMGYHGGMPTHQRSAIQEAFVAGTNRVLVATNAFGMGIDKSDVRSVVHTDLTLTLEAYYQEAGRAGRDGEPAQCTLIYQQEDRRLMDFYIESTYPEREVIERVYAYLCTRAGLAMGASNHQPILVDAPTIASALHTAEVYVRGVIALLERSGVIVCTTAHGSARIVARTTHERIDEFAAKAPPEYFSAVHLVSRFLKGRTAGSEIDIPISEMLLRSDVTVAELQRALHALQMGSLIRYQAPNTGGGIVLLSERVPFDRLPIEYQQLSDRRARAVQKLNVMVGYAETRQCKHNYILSYFGDVSSQGTCGKCSSCKEPVSSLERPLSERTSEHVVALIRIAWQLRGAFGRHVLVDVLRGIYSPKIQEHRLDRSLFFGKLQHRSKAELLEAIDVALDRGLLLRTADLYPTIGVTPAGKDIASPLPKQLQSGKGSALAMPVKQNANADLLAALLAMRERIAEERNIAPSAICTLDELEAIAQDRPHSVDDLVPGKHGSSLFLIQYRSDLQACLQHAILVPTEHVGSDADVLTVVSLIHDSTTFERLTEEAQMSRTTLAALLQRGIESGVAIERGNLVDDDLYVQVKEYLRYHRYAKLRDVRSSLGVLCDMPELRITVAFARRDLYADQDVV